VCRKKLWPRGLCKKNPRGGVIATTGTIQRNKGEKKNAYDIKVIYLHELDLGISVAVTELRTSTEPKT